MNLRLTAAGERTFRGIYPTAERHQDRALRGFSSREINTLSGYLQRIQAHVEAEE